jgi:lysophospholipase L1-like esterase
MLVLLLLRLVDYAPDLVLVCSGASDLIVAREFDPRPGYPYNFFLLEELQQHFLTAGRDGEPLAPATFMDRAAARQIRLRSEAGWPGSAWEEAVVEAYLGSVGKLGRIAAAYALDTVLVLEPMVVTRDPPTAEEARFLKPETWQYYERQYRRLRAGLSSSDLVDRRALTIHDGSAALAGEAAAVFRDYIHFNETGSRLMAAYLAGIVQDRLAARGDRA